MKINLTGVRIKSPNTRIQIKGRLKSVIIN